MSFENAPNQAPQSPEDGIVVLDDFVMPEESEEVERKRRDLMNQAVTEHMINKSKENLAAVLALLEPINRNTDLMANNFKSEQTA